MKTGVYNEIMQLLDVLFPARCMGCGRVGNYICISCQKAISLLSPRCPACDRSAIDGITHPKCQTAQGLDGLITVFRYDGVVKKVIKAIKYRFIYDSAKSLIDIIPDSIFTDVTRQLENPVLYPIPLHRDRLKWRGFNQAEKLGEIVAKRLNIQMVSGLLIRQEKRTPQADISHREDRIKNAQGLFKMNSSLSEVEGNQHGKSSTGSDRKIQYSNILLFDDVWTTGATMKEACKVLKRGGVKKVCSLTIAR